MFTHTHTVGAFLRLGLRNILLLTMYRSREDWSLQMKRPVLAELDKLGCTYHDGILPISA